LSLRSEGITDPFSCLLKPTEKSHISIISCKIGAYKVKKKKKKKAHQRTRYIMNNKSEKLVSQQVKEHPIHK
jgi:hypothetical protein